MFLGAAAKGHTLAKLTLHVFKIAPNKLIVSPVTWCASPRTAVTQATSVLKASTPMQAAGR